MPWKSLQWFLPSNILQICIYQQNDHLFYRAYTVTHHKEIIQLMADDHQFYRPGRRPRILQRSYSFWQATIFSTGVVGSMLTTTCYIEFLADDCLFYRNHTIPSRGISIFCYYSGINIMFCDSRLISMESVKCSIQWKLELNEIQK